MSNFSTTIYINPIGKARARTVQRGNKTWTYTPSQTVDAEAGIRLAVLDSNITLRHIPIKLEAIFYLNKPKSTKREYPVVRPDLDNLTKLLTDALQHFLYEDDAQIVDCSLSKRYGSPPRITLRMEEVKDGK